MKRFMSCRDLAFLGLAAVDRAGPGAGPGLDRPVASADERHVRRPAPTSWPISTARSGYATPRGSYAPTSLQRMHYSRKYHMSPMPYSIFFRGGYAIHGTYSTGALGRPASHGCVRLAPGNAAALYAMVQREGASISISGRRPGPTMIAQRARTCQRPCRRASREGDAPMAYAPTTADLCADRAAMAV